MPILRSIKEERFASAVAEGMTSEQAYKEAGFIGLKAKQNGEKLRCKAEVKARIKELTGRISKRAVDRAAKRLSLTKELLLAELWDNAQAGKKVKGGSSVRNRSLELIAKLMGYFPEEGTEKLLDVEDLTADQIRQLLGDDAPPKPDIFQ